MTLKPMLATAAGAVPEGPEWLLEPKFDGWRCLFHKGSEEAIEMLTRTGKAITQVPYISDVLRGVPEDTWLDGEIVDLSGGAQWNRTQSILGSDKLHGHHFNDPPLTYVIFDILELMGKNLRGETLEDRKKLLHALLAMMPEDDRALVRPCEELPCNEASLERLVGEGYEGVVCKRRSSHYYLDARSHEWLKIKPVNEVEVEITGFYAPDVGSKYEGRAVGGFEWAHGTGKFRVAGRCGTGMDDPTRERMLSHPEEFVGRVAEVKHWGLGKDGALRFPSLKRIRDPKDKDEPTPVAPSAPEPVVGNGRRGELLDRLVDAEEERDNYKEKWEVAQARLNGTLRKAATGKGSRTRNYNAMKPDRLRESLLDLRQGAGEGYEKGMACSGDITREITAAEAAAHKKGVIV